LNRLIDHGDGELWASVEQLIDADLDLVWISVKFASPSANKALFVRNGVHGPTKRAPLESV